MSRDLSEMRIKSILVDPASRSLVGGSTISTRGPKRQALRQFIERPPSNARRDFRWNCYLEKKQNDGTKPTIHLLRSLKPPHLTRSCLTTMEPSVMTSSAIRRCPRTLQVLLSRSFGPALTSALRRAAESRCGRPCATALVQHGGGRSS